MPVKVTCDTCKKAIGAGQEELDSAFCIVLKEGEVPIDNQEGDVLIFCSKQCAERFKRLKIVVMMNLKVGL